MHLFIWALAMLQTPDNLRRFSGDDRKSTSDNDILSANQSAQTVRSVHARGFRRELTDFTCNDKRARQPQASADFQ